MSDALHELPIDADWTLFLDRDGVLNEHRPDDYVKSWSEWVWCGGALAALKGLRPHFGRIIVVTNQQGIGRGLMSEDDLRSIHWRMHEEVRAIGGSIDAVYVAPELKSDPANRRKPKPAMGLEAKADFPEIEFERSILVGDSPSDIAFGKALGMITVGIGSRSADAQPDFAFGGLAEFAAALGRG